MSAAIDAAGEQPRDRRRSAVAWGVLLTAAVIVYELTTQPGLAGLTLALKAGLRDFRTAFWLRFRDPEAGRGAANFWLYVCTGMGLTCFAALGLLVTLCVIVGGLRLRPGPVVTDVAKGCGLTLLATAAVSLLAGVWAAVRAGIGGHRLWLSGGVHAARRVGAWPPRPVGPNQFPAVLALTACGVIFVLLPSLYALGTALAPGVFVRPRPGGPNAPALVAFVLAWWAAVLLLVRYWNRLRLRLTARRPADAWPDPPAPADPTDPYWERWANG
jgi:hypothetical protein